MGTDWVEAQPGGALSGVLPQGHQLELFCVAAPRRNWSLDLCCGKPGAEVVRGAGLTEGVWGVQGVTQGLWGHWSHLCKGALIPAVPVWGCASGTPRVARDLSNGGVSLMPHQKGKWFPINFQAGWKSVSPAVHCVRD